MKIFKFIQSSLASYLNDNYHANSHKPRSERLRSLVFKRVIIWLEILLYVSRLFWKYISDSTGLASLSWKGQHQIPRVWQVEAKQIWVGAVHRWKICHGKCVSHWLTILTIKKLALYAVCLGSGSTLLTLKNLVLNDAFILKWCSSGSTKIHLCSEKPNIKP